MSKKEVIKHSGAIQVSNNRITLLQRRAWNVLLANAYDDLPIKEQFDVSLKDLSDILSYNSNNYEALKEALRALRRVEIEWNILDKDQEEWVNTSLLGEVKITKNSGRCFYSYGPELKKKLYNPAMYARISLSMQNRFNSKYSLALYELCVDYFIKKQGKGETPWISIEDFKKLMGVQDEKTYQDFKNLKRFIINIADSEINKKSDLFIEIDYKKESRKVVAMKIKITPNDKDNKILTKLIQVPAQEQLDLINGAEKEKSDIFNRLVKYFLLSESQANEIIETKEEEYIAEVLKYIEEKKLKNEIKANLGAYTYKALTEDYRPKTSLFDLEKEQTYRQKQEAEAKKKAEEEIIKQLENNYFAFTEGKIEEMLAALPEKIKKQIYDGFKDSLDNFSKEKYNREGLNSVLVKRLFNRFVVDEYLKETIPDFQSYAKIQGYILDRQGESWKFNRQAEIIK